MLQSQQKRIRRNIILSTLLSLFLLFSLALISSLNHNRLLLQAENIQANYSDVHDKLATLRTHVGELRRYEKDILLNRNDRKMQANYQARWEEQVADSEKIIAHLSAIDMEGIDWPIYVSDLDRDLDAYVAGARQIFFKAQARIDLTAPDFNRLILEHKPPVRRLGNDLTAMAKHVYDQEKAGLQAMRKTRVKALYSVALLALFMFAVISIASGALYRQTSKIAAKMEYDANHDPLTKVLNRSGFERIVKADLSRPPGDQKRFFIYIDLDELKIINDLFSHQAGDRVLCGLAQLLEDSFAHRGCVGRLGGDEFCVFLKIDNQTDLPELLNGLLKNVRTTFVPYKGATLSATISVGVRDITNHSAKDYDQSLLDCDLACYVAKKNGKDRYQIHGTDTLENALRKNRGWAYGIKDLIENDRLRLAFQEITPLQGSARNCELLLRAESETGHIIGPAQLIPSAEQFNMIQVIDRWVVTTALSYLRRGILDDFDIVSINISGSSFSCPEFAIFLKQALGDAPDLARRICVEITESAAATNIENAILLINSIRDYGCVVALDDFGTGFSTFDYLRKLPVDRVKIDSSFIQNLITDPACRVIVRSFIDVARTLNLVTLAEGVETRDEFEILKDLGIDFVQGYYLHRPEIISPPADARQKVA